MAQEQVLEDQVAARATKARKVESIKERSSGTPSAWRTTPVPGFAAHRCSAACGNRARVARHYGRHRRAQ
jgi:hypothetical protein